MKTFKFKSNFYSLMAIGMLSLFTVSCDKEEIEIQPESVNTQSQDEIEDINGKVFILPLGMDDLSEVERNSYLDNIDKETFESLSEHSRIYDFLEGINQLESITQKMNAGDIFTLDNVSNQLSQSELNKLSTFPLFVENSFTDDASVAAKGGCTSWYATNSYYRSCSWGYCTLYRIYKRRCTGFWCSRFCRKSKYVRV